MQQCGWLCKFYERAVKRGAGGIFVIFYDRIWISAHFFIPVYRCALLPVLTLRYTQFGLTFLYGRNNNSCRLIMMHEKGALCARLIGSWRFLRSGPEKRPCMYREHKSSLSFFFSAPSCAATRFSTWRIFLITITLPHFLVSSVCAGDLWISTALSISFCFLQLLLGRRICYIEKLHFYSQNRDNFADTKTCVT